MLRDESACNTYNYGDSDYWDARYINESSFDWYQRYDALRPFLTKYIQTSSRVLMVGCGNAVISEDMVKDGYESIMNVDISCVAIEMMRRKYEHVPQLELQLLNFSLSYLKDMQMDVRDMGFFLDNSFDSVIDKGTLDALMCGSDGPTSASQMLGEVSRVLKPGGVYMLISYGDPKSRMPHINRPTYSWKIDLYIIPRPGFQKPAGSTSSPKSYLSPIPITENGMLPADYVIEDPDSHFIYVCTKINKNSDSSESLTVDT
ncbi:hypothetical protein M8C21_022512 [Ambrosia artemisiifolia]|uniref:Methyltransferase type 11 domain-containing protein n=1 Tax=Ambrosia artemisiifolia TaxID=4212 RepID=A0AAD5BPK7_AMBAR|nr:hypothetical protein M8C21_022512 [Ambrosia artemisiifolia]